MLERNMIPGPVGLGNAYGDRLVTSSEVVGMIDFSDWENARGENRVSHNSKGLEAVAAKVIRSTQVEQRFWVSGSQGATRLAAEALREAIRMSGVKRADFGGVTVGTMTQDYGGTALSPALQSRLRLPERGRYRDVGAACSSFLHAAEIVNTSMMYEHLTSGDGYVAPQAAVGVEVISKRINFKDPQTAGLFADGSGAVVYKMVPDTQKFAHRITFVTGADGRYQRSLGIEHGGSLHPITRRSIREGKDKIHMDGKVVAREAVARMTEYLEYAMQQANVKPEDISLLIPHQANGALVDKVAQNLNFPAEKAYKNIQRRGNTSAGSIPGAMKDAYDDGLLLPDKLIAIVAFSGGFIFGAAILPTTGLPERRVAVK